MLDCGSISSSGMGHLIGLQEMPLELLWSQGIGREFSDSS
jgi:hypothetical protein